MTRALSNRYRRNQNDRPTPFSDLFALIFFPKKEILKERKKKRRSEAIRKKQI
jgi:hypothetical protein